jgi:hypothetical protein
MVFSTLLSVLALASCSTASSEDSRVAVTKEVENSHAAVANEAAFAAPTQLVATLTEPDTIALIWKNNATEAGGYFVEFRTNPDEDFTLLDAVWADTNTFRHMDLAPETDFSYRIRPFFGGVSNVVEITTGKALSKEEAYLEEEGPLVEGVSDSKGAIKKKSIRTTLTAKEAVPANLTIAPSSMTNVVLRWQDHAKDEDGYLVEVLLDSKKGFEICALLPPDTTSFRKVGLHPQTKFYFRVRAYFYGKPSNLATARSGK